MNPIENKKIQWWWVTLDAEQILQMKCSFVFIRRIEISAMISTNQRHQRIGQQDLRVMLDTEMCLSKVESTRHLILLWRFSWSADDLVTLLQSVSIHGLFLGVHSSDHLFRFQRPWVSRVHCHSEQRGDIFVALDLNNGFRHVQNAIKLCQALSVLEIIHPIIGFTKGDWTAPLIQVQKIALAIHWHRHRSICFSFWEETSFCFFLSITIPNSRYHP